MAYTTQYRPIGTAETADDEGVSTRIVRDLNESIDNYKGRFGPVLISDAWPNDTCASVTGTDENVILQFAGRYVTGGYNRLAWAISAQLSTYSASESTTWRLYASWYRYKGVQAITSAGKADLGPYLMDSLAVTGSADPLVKSSTGPVLFPNFKGLIYLMLTAQNAGAGYTCSLFSMNATCWIKDA